MSPFGGLSPSLAPPGALFRREGDKRGCPPPPTPGRSTAAHARPSYRRCNRSSFTAGGGAQGCELILHPDGFILAGPGEGLRTGMRSFSQVEIWPL